jgi:AcrR family transcriptional regulator
MNIVHKGELSMPKMLPDNLKEEILTTTRRMVIEHGYNKVSIRDIARECGIATGTFYNYFRSKQEILSALLAGDWDRMQRYIATLPEDSNLSPVRQLEEIFNSLKVMMRAVHQLWALGFPDDFMSESMNKMAHIKRQLRADMASTITLIIHGHVDKAKELFLADFIARTFFSYAYEESSRFEDISFVLEILIK